MKPADCARIDKFRVRVFRTVLRMHNAGMPAGSRTSDVEVWRRARRLPTQEVVRQARLRFLRRMLLVAPPCLQALAQEEAAGETGWGARSSRTSGGSWTASLGRRP